VTGTLNVDTAGGPLVAQGVAGGTVTLTTGGGQARITALTASSGTGPQQVGIATDPAASRSLTVISGGGTLIIEPTGAG
jgi:hypothetical protein